MITRRNIIKEKRESKNITLEELSSKLNISLNELKK